MMKKSAVVIICSAFLLTGTGLAYLIVDKINTRKSQERLENEHKMKDEKIQRLQQETVELKKTLSKGKEVIGASQEKLTVEQPQGKLAVIFGEETPPSIVSPESIEEENVVPAIDCALINEKIINFFSYLDTREYVKEYQLKNGTYAYFKNIASKLLEQKPMVGEKKFPESILKNTYHFYRAISKRNIILIKDIIQQEKDFLEQTIGYFYQQHIHCNDTEMFLPPFDALYEYSHFFLNTLGGAAYLFRLESRVRILLFYYSIMIIHEANNREINKYGIDILPYIKILEDEMKSYTKFDYSEKYLNEIELVKKKYSAHYPTGSS